MKDKKLIASLSEIITFSGDKERQVEAIYNTLFKDSFEGIRISNPFKCDGYFETIATIKEDDGGGRSRMFSL